MKRIKKMHLLTHIVRVIPIGLASTGDGDMVKHSLHVSRDNAEAAAQRIAKKRAWLYQTIAHPNWRAWEDDTDGMESLYITPLAIPTRYRLQRTF